MAKGSRRKRRKGTRRQVQRRPEASPDGQASEFEALELGAVRAEYYEGPLPPPELFREYESILPGSGAQIMDETRKNGAHRRRSEFIVVVANALAFVFSNVGSWVIDAVFVGARSI